MPTSSEATSFLEAISDPALGGNSEEIYESICTSAIFFTNLTYFVLYAILIVFLVYNIAQAIYKVTASDAEESYEKFRAGVTNAVLAAFALALISGIGFWPTALLNLIGYDGADNFIEISSYCDALN